jgi:hypothetical protein
MISSRWLSPNHFSFSFFFPFTRQRVVLLS